MAEQAALVRSWSVGKRTVTATMQQPRRGQVSHSVMEWSPDQPRRLSRRELREYRKGRDVAYAELFAELGLRGVVLEI